MLTSSNFHSEQLIDLMLHTGNTPDSHLLSLFDHLENAHQQHAFEDQNMQNAIFNANLTTFCVKLCQQSKANNPEVLADHILFIAENAFNQQMSQPETSHLMHAKKVANALILAQTKPELRFGLLVLLNQHSIAIAFTMCGLLVGGFLFWQHTLNHQANERITNTPPSENFTFNSSRSLDSGLTAQEASAMYAKYETMRKGTCQFIEAIQIPDQDKSVYLESVVGGKIPTNLKDLATANAYLEKIRCNYTPMLMMKSK